MKDSYFILNNYTYILSYVDFNLEIFRLENDQRVPLSDSEKEMIKDIVKKHNSYIYSSYRLDEAVANNEGINNNVYAPNLLEWVESIIPENNRDDLYRNLETLKVLETEAFEEEGKIGNYNIVSNTVTYLPKGNTRKVARAVNHELIHMASSNYDQDNGVMLSGFDTIGNDYTRRNKGLTEGFTEVLALMGTPYGEDEEHTNDYSVEGLLVNQLSQIVNVNTMSESFFGNKGTALLEKELNDLFLDKVKAFRLFRDIEMNYMLSSDVTESNFLGNAQSALIDYFDQKLELAFANTGHEIENITGMMNRYEQTLVTEDKLSSLGKDPSIYKGVKESIDKFQALKEKYVSLMDVPELDENIVEEAPVEEYIPRRKAGYGSVFILGLAASSISIGILLLGMWICK